MFSANRSLMQDVCRAMPISFWPASVPSIWWMGYEQQAWLSYDLLRGVCIRKSSAEDERR
jgi:hypothetical protein